jgi:membrane fusion protein (multidrug efflux system)
VPNQSLYVVANFKETQVGLMRAGQRAEITVDALAGVTFHGTVESVTPGTGANFSLIPPQNATGNFTKIVQRVPVRIRIDAGPQARRVLVPGLSLNVKVDTNSAKDDLAAIRAEADSAK